MRWFATLFLVLFLIMNPFQRSTLAQSVPIPCDLRPTRLNQPWIKTNISCLEEVINVPAQGELAFTALAATPDGALYAARPLSGEVLVFIDTDDDGMPDSPRVVAQGLTLPNALAFHDDALYIAGGAHVYRLRGDALETLVDDLPSGTGIWTGSIAVGDDGRIYVGTGAACDDCADGAPGRGAVLSFALDGSDRQTEATGLRQPAALAFMDGELWLVDSASDRLFDTPELDELNRLVRGADFGFPHCVGVENVPAAANADCDGVIPPVLALPTGSNPVGLAAYRGDAIPELQGRLMIVLRGSYNDLDLRGYLVVSADPQTGAVEPFMPARPDDTALSAFTTEEMNYRGSGFFPRRPLGVAVNEQGWVYISVSGGRILLLRPDILP